VLQQLSEQVRECHRRAADAKAQADATIDPAMKRSYSDLADRWLFLARSHMFTESLQDFVDQAPQRTERTSVDPKLPIVGQLFDLLPVAIYVCDPSGLIIYYNSHAAKLWDRSPSLNDPTDRFCGSYRMYHLDGGPIEHPDCPMAEVLRSGDPVQNREIVVERADGSRAVVLVNINPFKDCSGNILGAVNCFQDVTERKRTERQITTLAGEAEHRAKNVLAVVQAMVRLSQSETVEGFKQAIDGRIRALANVHALFVRSRWTGAELRSLVEEELSPYSRGAASRRLEGPTVSLAQDAAQTVAVAMHELATNATKYGALSRDEGHVDVTWSQSEDGQLVIHWSETGGPPVPTSPSHQGFGSRVIDNMLRTLSGKVYFNWRPEGLECKITLPMGTSGTT
jgi:two-component sensor histidine kinase/PAS domain-containing protein